jgi:hypothetical protein
LSKPERSAAVYARINSSKERSSKGEPKKRRVRNGLDVIQSALPYYGKVNGKRLARLLRNNKSIFIMNQSNLYKKGRFSPKSSF